MAEDLSKTVKESNANENNEKTVNKNEEFDVEAALFGDNQNKIQESHNSLVENSGGSVDELNSRTAEVDARMNEIQKQTEEKIEEVKVETATQINEVKKENLKVGEINNFMNDKSLSLSEKITFLEKNNIVGSSEYIKSAINNSELNVDEIKELVKSGKLDLNYIPQEKRKEIYNLADLTKKLDAEVERFMNSQNSDELFDNSALREMVLTYGVVDELNAEHYLKKVEDIANNGKVNVELRKRADQFKNIIDEYKKRGQVGKVEW